MWRIETWAVGPTSSLGDWQDGGICEGRTTGKGVSTGEDAGLGTCWAWIDLGLYK